MGLPVSEQLVLPGSCTNPTLVAARFLLTPGKTYLGKRGDDGGDSG
jgi:hypothetical protein